MKKTKDVPFSSPELAAAFERVSGAVSNIGSKLDLISNDIKRLEGALGEMGVTQPARVRFGEISDQFGEEVLRWKECVLWDKGDNGKYRLFYETTCIGYDEPINLTPLIECKREVRIRAHKVLPDLLLKIGGNIDPDLAVESRDPALGTTDTERK